MSDWKETILWKTLNDSLVPDADSVKTTLKQCMPNIQTILAQAGTSPSDFTLHDSGHSFRVAQRMAQIIPADLLSRLSPFELALLLMSAYLHDIGMTPERRNVVQLHGYLLIGDAQDLSQDEIRQFQKWLDDEGSGIVPPMVKEKPTNEQLQRSEELLTYYCRDRHVDWSEDWIQKNLTKFGLGTYVGWTDDLIVLCHSHHEGYTYLAKDRFAPRIVGSQGIVIHLRYLSVILRIADILEFDPERTPDVILRHRDISLKSLIYWWKDHEISMRQENNRILITARPPSARFHRAIEVMTDQIDAELQLCRTLADETHFEKCPGLTEDLPHHWDLFSSAHRDIKPKDDSYEYINGAFRPDTQKLLQLLSGVALYGNPLVAVRELLQNAFDAVREQIAYQRLAKSNPADSSLGELLGKLNEVELRVEITPKGTWLVCKDSGVAMTKTIIVDHLLVSGTAKRHDILELERRCNQAGFPLERTGEFGIGVLSYFMIADRLIMKTRRSQESGNIEKSGWQFETEGVGSFGELRRDTNFSKGTEVWLHLRPTIMGHDPNNLFVKLRDYLEETLLRIPCSFRCCLPGVDDLEFTPGWTRTEINFSKAILHNLNQGRRNPYSEETPVELLPLTRRQVLQAEEQNWEQTQTEILECLRWKNKEGMLPDNLGHFRIHLPYFELPGGASLGFLQVRKLGNEFYLEKLGKGYVFVPSSPGLTGWKGMLSQYRFAHRRTESFGPIIEIDLTSDDAATISVNRNEINYSKQADQAIVWLQALINAMYQEFHIENYASVYSMLNCRLTQGRLPPEKKNWLSVKQNKEKDISSWGPIKYPAISSLTFAFNDNLPMNLVWKKKPVSIVRCLAGLNEDDHYDGISWNPRNFPPHQIVQIDSYTMKISGLWTSSLPSSDVMHVMGVTSIFPPNWQNLCAVKFKYFYQTNIDEVVWNPHHPIVRAVDESSWTWCLDKFKASCDPLPHREEILTNKGRVAAWFVLCLQKEEKYLWDGLKDRDPLFLPQVWQIIFDIPVENRLAMLPQIIEWVQDTSPRLRVLTPEGWDVCLENEQIKKYLPDPGLEWRVVDKDRKMQEASWAKRLASITGQKSRNGTRVKKRK
ncbi:MAG TPA: hypothetical protein DCG53_06435 [Syntrophus sp. (in: bacteria)]|nr:hypothetical protein [Syntrophus sp. (in: bacteria)]